MSNIEIWLLVGGVFFYFVSLTCEAISSRSRMAAFLLLTGVLLQAASAGIRWHGIGHSYEDYPL